jgi:mannose-6-phosphate isomerase-like protein (cupin superfamily)
MAEDLVSVWQDYLKTIDWRDLVVGTEPKNVGCGLVYELPNPAGMNRPNEDFVIADMRGLAQTPGHSEPHYHPDGVTEVYFVLEGSGLSVMGGAERQLTVGDVLVTPPNHAHYVIPDEHLVLGAVSSPPFTPETYIPVAQSDPKVGFDQDQLEKLLRKNA